MIIQQLQGTPWIQSSFKGFTYWQYFLLLLIKHQWINTSLLLGFAPKYARLGAKQERGWDNWLPGPARCEAPWFCSVYFSSCAANVKVKREERRQTFQSQLPNPPQLLLLLLPCHPLDLGDIWAQLIWLNGRHESHLGSLSRRSVKMQR